jgi:hypothetical protein
MVEALDMCYNVHYVRPSRAFKDIVNGREYQRLFFFEPAYEVLTGGKTLVGQTAIP